MDELLAREEGEWRLRGGGASEGEARGPSMLPPMRGGGVGEPPDEAAPPGGGLMRFSLWRRLQNQTRTTSFSMERPSASTAISSDVGLGFCTNAFSSATRTLVSMLVRFLRRRPIDSGVVWALARAAGLLSDASASSSHRCSSGFSLHMFLKLRLSASNREMVVWLKSLPYSFPIARPTSPCVKPSLIRLCLNVLANCSSSSKSVISSGLGSAGLDLT